VLRVDRLVGRTDFERGPHGVRVGRLQVDVAREAVLHALLARLDLDHADVEPRRAVGREAERAAHVDPADRLVGDDVIEDRMAGPDEHFGSGAGDRAARPGGRLGPRTALLGFDDVGRKAGAEHQQGKDRQASGHRHTSSAVY
jgi:hypothetical protein